MRLLACILTLVILAPACRSESDDTSEGQQSFTGLLTQGQKAFKSGRYDRALESYREALKQQPDSAPSAVPMGAAVVYNLMGMAYRFKYNHKQDPELKKQEIAAFEKAVQLQPEFVVALVNLGSSHYYAGNKVEASKYFKKVVELAPHHQEVELLRKMIAESESPSTEE